MGAQPRPQHCVEGSGATAGTRSLCPNWTFQPEKGTPGGGDGGTEAWCPERGVSVPAGPLVPPPPTALFAEAYLDPASSPSACGLQGPEKVGTCPPIHPGTHPSVFPPAQFTLPSPQPFSHSPHLSIHHASHPSRNSLTICPVLPCPCFECSLLATRCPALCWALGTNQTQRIKAKHCQVLRKDPTQF